MKYTIILSLISISLFYGALVNSSLRIFYIWTAISFGVVSIGYAGLGYKIFGKNKDGTISLPLRILNLPFLLYTWSIWHIYRTLSREDAFNTIDENLVIGRRLLSSEVTEEFDHYVDLTSEFDEPLSIRSAPMYLSFPILDAHIPSVEQLNLATNIIQEGRTYIHCAQGHGRTGLFALALLYRRGQIQNSKEGIDLLKKSRPSIKLNKKQSKFIHNYILQLEKEKSH